MAYKKIFLDANILLEVLYKRNKESESKSLMAANIGYSVISAVSIHISNYFLEKDKQNIVDKEEFYNAFEIIALSDSIITKAYQIYNQDFEDAIQVASFLQSDCDEFWTLDKKLQTNYGKIATIKLL
ncbi:MAG: PIN domain-containing protein [bacterium]